MTVAELVKTQREKLGFSQRGLAAKVGCSGEAVSMIESGLRCQTNMSFVLGMRLVKILRITPWQLLTAMLTRVRVEGVQRRNGNARRNDG